MKDSKRALALLVATAMVISGLAELTEHLAALVQVAVLLALVLIHQVHLLDPAHPFIRVMLLVGVALAMIRSGRITFTVRARCAGSAPRSPSRSAY